MNGNILLSDEAEFRDQFFEKFRAAGEKNGSRIEKQEKIILDLRSEIDGLERNRNENLQMAAACKAIIQSNSYPVLAPVVRYVSVNANRNAEKDKRKTAKIKKRIGKIEKKLHRMKAKDQQIKLLKSMVYSDNAKSFINGLMSLNEDSLERTNDKLVKVKKKQKKAEKKLLGAVSDNDRAKIEQRMNRFNKSISKLEDRLGSLKTLEQSLSEARESGTLGTQINEFKKSVIEAAVKSAEKSSISKTVDDIALASSNLISSAVDNPPMENSASQAEEQPINRENDNTRSVEQDSLRKRIVGEKELTAIVNAGVPVTVVKTGTNYTVVFNKSLTERIDKAVSQITVKSKKGRSV